ncbi:MAG: TonB-dependent siderophore receptor [Chlorobi bacterium]|nr:TonB-dependent siderophore receptor [Chlorobiota bacterium]
MKSCQRTSLAALLPLLSLLAATPGLAQSGRIEGRVVDIETQEPVVGASIKLDGTSRGTITSSTGAFTLSNLPSGELILVVKGLGFKGDRRTISGSGSGTTRVTIELVSEPIIGQGVTVSTERSSSYVPRIGSTATKTMTPIRDIPASIVVIPSIVLKDQGAGTLDQSIGNASGITQSSQSNYGFFNNYVVRGLRLRFLRDGVPDGPTTNGYARTLTDVDHVEVLKGPGSAVYGSSEPGGTINLVTKPAPSHPALSVYQSAGSFSAFKTVVDAGAPIATDVLNGRVSFGYQTKAGYRGLENKTLEILPSLTWLPAKDQTLTASFDYRKIDLVADTYGILLRGHSVLDVSTESRYYTPFGTTNQKVIRGALLHTARFSDAFSLRSDVTVLHRDLYLLRNAGGTLVGDTLSARRLRQQTDNASDIIAQIEPTLKVTTGFMEHLLLGGLEFDRSSIKAVRSTANLPSIVNVEVPVVPETSMDKLTFKGDFDRDITIGQYGAYLQDQVTITNGLKARVGARWDQFVVDDIHNTDTLGASRSDGRLSVQGGIVYQPVEELSLYGGVARGNLSTVSTESNRISEPENSTQIELGGKLALLEGLLNVNATVFDVKREKFNVTIGTELLPVGAQRTRGLELDIAGQPTTSWGFTANYAYYSAQITSNPADTGSVGKQPVGVPASSAGLWTSYRFTDGFLKGLGFGGGVTYRDEFFFDAHNTTTIPSYLTADATIFYRQGLYELQLNANNLTDAVYYRNGVNAGVLPGDPRSLQASVRINL